MVQMSAHAVKVWGVGCGVFGTDGKKMSPICYRQKKKKRLYLKGRMCRTFRIAVQFRTRLKLRGWRDSKGQFLRGLKEEMLMSV